MTRTRSSLRLLALLLPAAGAVVMASTLSSGTAEPLPLGMLTWLYSPYVAVAVVLLVARRSPHRAFWWTAVVTGAVVLAQTAWIAWITLTSEDDLAGVGLFFSPIANLPFAGAGALVGLILHLLRRHSADSHDRPPSERATAR